MASVALVIFGLHKREGMIDSNFVSQNVSAGTSTPCPAGYNVVNITATTGNVYAAFGNTTVTANAALDPRVWVQAGSNISVTCAANTTVSIIDG